MSGSIACAMQQLLIAMLIFYQQLSGVHSQGPSAAPVGPYTNQEDSKPSTKVLQITLLLLLLLINNS